MNNKKELYFPNGFTSWYETFYEVVDKISWLDSECTYFNYPTLENVIETQGRGGLYELAKELTDKFELKFKDVEWGVDEFTDYYDELEKFLEKELK